MRNLQTFLNPLQSRYTNYLQELELNCQFRKLPQAEYIDSTTIRCHHQDYLVMASNNYLGLTDSIRVRNASINALKKYGTSSTGSRLVTGSNILFDELERKLASFKKTDSSLVFNTGYMANIGIISALVQKGDLILSDELNHASIIDGCKLSKASVQIYRHKDIHHLESLLKKSSTNNILIVTDSVFSMDGDIAPIYDIYQLSRKYNTLLMVDDAHATGVIGKGFGSGYEFNLEGKIDIQMGTLSKALASVGGFVATSNLIRDYLINKSRAFIFSTALTPADIAASIEAIRIIEDTSQIVDQLKSNISYLAKKLNEIGLASNNKTPIFPIIFNCNEEAVKISQFLFDNNIIATAIRPPTIPEGTSRLRVTVTAAHNKKQLDYFINVLKKALNNL